MHRSFSPPSMPAKLADGLGLRDALPGPIGPGYAPEGGSSALPVEKGRLG